MLLKLDLGLERLKINRNKFMIIYNVTVTVQNEIVEEWLNWIRLEHIPEVLSTGLFIDSVLKELLPTTMMNLPLLFHILARA